MLKHALYTRSGATAIAASLTLISTPAFAQDATTVPDPSVSAPAPATSEPVTIETPAISTTTMPDVQTSVDTTTAVETTPVAKSTAKKAATVAKPATPAKPLAVASSTKSDAAPTAEATQAQAVSSAPAAAATDTPATAPVPATPLHATNADNQNSAELAFGGALALLVIGGAGFALTRRRREDEEDSMIVSDSSPVLANSHVERTAPVATTAAQAPTRSAFAWSAPAPAMAQTSRSLSPTERALKGPTADNPSLSLKKRLKRAHFFEVREREAARGDSVGVSRFAGIPESLIAKAREAKAEPTTQRQNWHFQPA